MIFKYAKTFSYVLRNLSSGAGVFPFYASYKVTSECTLRCAHCYIPKEHPTRDVDTASCKEIIRNLASSSPLVLAFEGGEPFLRDDLEELVAYSKRFPILVSIVTAYPEAARGRYARLSKYVDFLQVSVDESHDNLHLLDRLDDIRNAWNGRVCVQTVVTAETLDGAEEKARKAREGRCKILFIPLSPIYPELSNLTPEKFAFAEELRRLKKKYPRTVICSRRFLDSYARGKGCTTSTIVIDSDGWLFYPCHVLKTKAFNLLEGRLEDFLLSERADALRTRMEACSRGCAWYQYFALSLKSFRDLPNDVSSSLERVT